MLVSDIADCISGLVYDNIKLERDIEFLEGSGYCCMLLKYTEHTAIEVEFTDERVDVYMVAYCGPSSTREADPILTLRYSDPKFISALMKLIKEIASDLDPACLSLVKVMNRLPGIVTTSSCCGHGRDTFHIFFEMDPSQIGADVLARCLSGRYYNYFPGEQRNDPCWRAYVADTESRCHFLLEGKVIGEDADVYEPAEKLAANIQKHVDEGFVTMWKCRGYSGINNCY